jgi:DNA-directed RNA polymerase specialized sigma24 family protein
MARVGPVPFGFTPEECARYEKFVPDIPEEAVAHIIHEYGCADLEDDLLQEAYLGTVKGVQTFDPTKATKEESERQWVFFSALRAAQTVWRRERRGSNRVVARMWNGLIQFSGSEHHTPRVMSDREEDRAGLTGFCSRAVGSAIVGVAVLEVPSGGGDKEMVERMTAARCKVGLARALGDLSGRRHELLRLCFADDQSVKDAAETRGEKAYRAELVEFHRALNLVAARLEGMGFDDGLPPFPPEADGTLLRESVGHDGGHPQTPGASSDPPALPMKP